MNKKWKIVHKPNPEFNGYPWHEPSTDPTQYHIVLESELFKMAIAVLWPAGEVWIEDPDEEGDSICVGGTNEFGDFQDRLGATNYLSKEAIQEIKRIIKAGYEEWDQLKIPDFSILRPPIEY